MTTTSNGRNHDVHDAHPVYELRDVRDLVNDLDAADELDGRVLVDAAHLGDTTETRHETRHDENGHELVEGVVIDTDPDDPAMIARRAGLGGGVGLPALPSRPIVPDWLRTHQNRRAAVVWGAQYAAHSTGYHALRLPVYWARLAARAPIGLGRLLTPVFRWVFDADGAAVRRAIAQNAGSPGSGPNDASTYKQLVEQRKQTVRMRGTLVSLALAVLVASGYAVAVVLPAWQWVPLAAAVLALLGVAGRKADARIVTRYTDAADMPRMTSELIMTALANLGLSGLNKAFRTGEGVRFPAPVTRDGAGWRADIDLPPGVTATEVIDKREGLASGLRRPTSAVWPEGDNDVHAGRLVLWVADKPMSKAKPVTWPLAAKGAVDLFNAFPLGVDPRGRPVNVTLMYASMVVGAMPRAGKTFTGRVCMLGAALDPTAQLYIFDMKGGSDWLPLAPVCHAFRSVNDDDPEDMAYVLASLRELKKDMSRRYATIKSLPREVCPEGKVTRELANRRDLRLHPVVVFLDECQMCFEHEKHGKEFEAIVTDLTKRGPAAGITMISATQRPDAKSLPTGISSNAILRWCGRVQGHIANDLTLGSSMYQSGYRATMFSRSEAGVGYLAGEGDDPVIVRAAYIDANAAEKIVARARAARAAAGLLTGYAADEDVTPDDSTASVLDHLATVWPASEDKVWGETLAERLAEAFPGLYTGWTAQQVTDAAKPHGLTKVQIKRDGQNKRGLLRSDLANALAGRDADTQPEQRTDLGNDLGERDGEPREGGAE